MLAMSDLSGCPVQVYTASSVTFPKARVVLCRQGENRGGCHSGRQEETAEAAGRWAAQREGTGELEPSVDPGRAAFSEAAAGPPFSRRTFPNSLFTTRSFGSSEHTAWGELGNQEIKSGRL